MLFHWVNSSQSFEGTAVLTNVRNYLPDAAYHARRLGFEHHHFENLRSVPSFFT